jgi:hypothetical protein
MEKPEQFKPRLFDPNCIPIGFGDILHDIHHNYDRVITNVGASIIWARIYDILKVEEK